MFAARFGHSEPGPCPNRMTRKALGSLSPGVTGQWRGHGAGVARAIGIYWVWVARAWRGHGAGVARA
eukprot:gene14193-biopygen17086